MQFELPSWVSGGAEGREGKENRHVVTSVRRHRIRIPGQKVLSPRGRKVRRGKADTALGAETVVQCLFVNPLLVFGHGSKSFI